MINIDVCTIITGIIPSKEIPLVKLEPYECSKTVHRCNILICLHFPVNIKGGQKWNIHLGMNQGWRVSM